jgi:hypothetical protein
MSRFRIVNADRRRLTHDQPKTGGAINYSTGEENLPQSIRRLCRAGSFLKTPQREQLPASRRDRRQTAVQETRRKPAYPVPPLRFSRRGSIRHSNRVRFSYGDVRDEAIDLRPNFAFR